METLEVIAGFQIDSSINLLKILWNGEVYDMSYKIYHQWKEGDWLHLISICEKKDLIIELKFDTFFLWEVLRCENLN